jgi:transposase InsO family protein
MINPRIPVRTVLAWPTTSSRRTTPHPEEAFMRQIVRTFTMADAKTYGVRICDRDAKWSPSVRERLSEAGIRVVQTPYQAPNANAYAERFVRSIKEECLDRMIPLGERHFRGAVAEFVTHYHARGTIKVSRTP